MKKVISILAVLVVLIGSVFAADTLNITANVPKVAPVYAINGSLTSNFETVVVGGAANNTIETNTNISESPVTVYIKVIQTNKSVYKDASGVSLTVTPTALTNTADANEKTALPTIAHRVDGTATNLSVTGSENSTTKVVTFLCKYANGKPVAANSVIGTFDYTWAADANLAEGDYQATITMAYTTK